MTKKLDQFSNPFHLIIYSLHYWLFNSFRVKEHYYVLAILNLFSMQFSDVQNKMNYMFIHAGLDLFTNCKSYVGFPE